MLQRLRRALDAFLMKYSQKYRIAKWDEEERQWANDSHVDGATDAELDAEYERQHEERGYYNEG